MMTRPAGTHPEPPACPRHGLPLDGGPILWRCPSGHAVYAADLDTEYRPPAPAFGASPLVVAAFAWALTTSILTLVYTAVTR